MNIEFTEQEKVVLDLLVDVWNAFTSLPIEHPDHQGEFRHTLHDLQRQIMTRPVTRAFQHHDTP